MARACDIHQTEWGDLELGRRPTERQLRGLAKVFDTKTLAFLFDEVPESMLPVSWTENAPPPPDIGKEIAMTRTLDAAAGARGKRR